MAKFKDIPSDVLYPMALKAVGYELIPDVPLEKQVEDCLKDIASCGVFRNLEVEEIEDLTHREMAIGLINYGR